MMVMNQKLKKMLEVAFVAYFYIYLLGQIAKNYGNFRLAGTNTGHT